MQHIQQQQYTHHEYYQHNIEKKSVHTTIIYVGFIILIDFFDFFVSKTIYFYYC